MLGCPGQGTGDGGPIVTGGEIEGGKIGKGGRTAAPPPGGVGRARHHGEMGMEACLHMA